MSRRFSLSVAPRFLWECLTNRTVNPFPIPAASNPPCGFPAVNVFEHILCGMWPPELCGAQQAATIEINGAMALYAT